MDYNNGLSVKEAFKKYCKEYNVNINEKAKDFGISRSSLSRYINEQEYSGESFEQAVKDFLVSIKYLVSEDNPEEKTFQHSFTIHRTNNYNKILGGCQLTYKNKIFGMISGPSGCGKTTALKEFVRNKREVVYIRADEQMNVKTLLKHIKRALEIEGNVYNSYDAITEIVAELVESPRMVIIDEADKLLGTTTVKKIETLRSIWDLAKEEYGRPFPLLLVGMEELEYQVKGGKSGQKLAQVSSRIRPRIELKSVKEGELMEILRSYNMDDDAKLHVVTACKAENVGGLRTLRNTMENALQLAGDGRITLKIVRDAARLLLD